MARFSKTEALYLSPKSPNTVPADAEVIRSSAGEPAFARGPRNDLYLLAVSNLVDNTDARAATLGYETAEARNNRYIDLIRSVTAERPDGPLFVAELAKHLRQDLNMRTASVILALESAHERLECRIDAEPSIRVMVDSVIGRADDLMEAIGYWTNKWGRNLPAGVKRGLADAATRLLDERTVLGFYNKNLKEGWALADVVGLVHPVPRDSAQAALFGWMLRYRRDQNRKLTLDESLLPVVVANRRLHDKLRKGNYIPSSAELKVAGFRWENLSSYGKLTADHWESLVPDMGYLAILRNLRNMDEAGLSDAAIEAVQDKIKDSYLIAKSKVFPYQIYSAYLNTASDDWSQALKIALDKSTTNIPAFPGKTLILIDISPSMSWPLQQGGMSDRVRWEVGALFGLTLASRIQRLPNVAKASATVRLFDFHTQDFSLMPGESVLRSMDRLRQIQLDSSGTDVQTALNTWTGEDRIVIFTDEQTHQTYNYHRWRAGDSRQFPVTRDHIPARFPIYCFNIGGYKGSVLRGNNWYEYGGLTDGVFNMIRAIESVSNVGHPWQVNTAAH